MKNLKTRTMIIANCGQFVEDQQKINKKASRVDLIRQASKKYNYNFDTLKMILK